MAKFLQVVTMSWDIHSDPSALVGFETIHPLCVWTSKWFLVGKWIKNIVQYSLYVYLDLDVKSGREEQDLAVCLCSGFLLRAGILWSGALRCFSSRLTLCQSVYKGESCIVGWLPCQEHFSPSPSKDAFLEEFSSELMINLRDGRNKNCRYVTVALAVWH